MVTQQGSRYERRVCIVCTVDDTDRIDRMEWFDLEDHFAADAVVRLHELGTPVPTGPVLENAATLAERAALAGVDAHLRSGGAVALAMPPTAPDFVTDDRRPIVGMPDQNRSGVDAVIATMLAQGYVGASTEVVAVRGECLALNRRTWTTVSRDETHSLVVTELDGEGRFRRQTLFAEDDLEAAMAELDRRYFLGEGAEHADVLRAVGHFAAASANDDFARLRALLPDDFVTVDHRPLGFGSGDRGTSSRRAPRGTRCRPMGSW